jgi:hypothetical protein
MSNHVDKIMSDCYETMKHRGELPGKPTVVALQKCFLEIDELYAASILTLNPASADVAVSMATLQGVRTGLATAIKLFTALSTK